MSSARGSAFPRGRGRGSAQLGSRGRGRGASAYRGRVLNNASSQRGGTPARARGGFGQPTRGNTGSGGRGQNTTRGNAFAQTASTRNTFGGAKTGGSWQERYQALTKARDREREHAIRQGLVADPDKPRALSEAITPVGTCQDMCAEYERVQRVVQDDIWAEEKGADGEPDEARMVKKFRRAAAGLEEQLPSDLRSPYILQRTCDYLFNEVIGNATSLAQVHHFVWDRTRAVRNDFSIQQLTKLEELRIAVECYEGIARFHILSLHQLASPQRPYAKYDWSQEREQLDRTLLSLMQYYDDTRGRIAFPNEPEFRAYSVVFQLRSPTPDMEDNVQAWPPSIIRDGRVRRALDLYASGCTIMRPQGPLNPKASHLIARQDWQRMWTLVASNEVSYLMGCVTEVYFNSIRQAVLNALFRTFRANTTLPTPDWTLDVLCDLFAFDDEDEVQTFCEYFGFAFKDREDGQTFLDLSSVAGRLLPQPNAEMPNQLKSSLVEDKRLGRTLPAVINGLNARQAQDAGLVVEEEEQEDDMEDVDDGGEEETDSMETGQPIEEDEDSLFIPEDKKAMATQPEDTPALNNGFGTQPKPSPFSFGKPSGSTESPFGAAITTKPSDAGATKPMFDFLGGAKTAESDSTTTKPNFNFLGDAKPAEKTSPSFSFLGNADKTSESTAESKPVFKSPQSTAAPAATNAAAPKFDFTGGFSKAPQDAAPATTGHDGESAASKEKTGATAQQNGIFSALGQAQSSASSPFQFSAPLPKPTSPEKAPTTTTPSASGFPSLTPSAPKHATVESAPNSPEPSQSTFFPPQQKPAAPTSPETAPSFSSQPKQAQPHYTAPSANQPPSFTNSPPSPPTLNTGLRRPSTSTDTKPKKPSPLSNSFTAADDNNTTARESSAVATTAKESATERPPTQAATPTHQNQLPQFQQAASSLPTGGRQLKAPVPFKRSPSPSELVETFDATITRIAQELVEDPIRGYLIQYVEYRASQVITNVQEQIAAEKMKIRLSELRISTLYRKYLKRWISVIWHRRLGRVGKERRERRRKRLEEGFDDGSSQAGGSVYSSSRPASVMGRSDWKDHHQDVDAMFQRTINSRSLARSPPDNLQARAGSKRPTSSHGENGLMSKANGHKRLKSTSHVDERGRVTKPSASTNSNDDILKRSSFLGFSVNKQSPPNKNTTRSNYFRLKALGVHRADELSAPRGTKRPRTDSNLPAQTSPPALRNSASVTSSPEASTPRSLMPPPSSTMSRAEKAKEEDDALFARLRAARESLAMGATYMKQEVENDDELRRSLSASQSSNDSPSMIKARADARARASHGGSPNADVPAYRLRESKFVPREHYGRAIERSKEMRESRSRETSRPGSRTGSRLDQTVGKAPTSAPEFSVSTATDSQEKDHTPNGLPTSKSPAKAPSFEKTPQSFSPFARQDPFSFANHTTAMSDSNPFLQSTAQDSADSSKANPFKQFAAPKAAQETNTPTFGSNSELGAQTGFGAPSAFGLKNSFDGQQSSAPGSGFASGSQPAATQNSAFGSPFASASKPAFGNQSVQSPSAAPQDQTIQPSLIDQSLANSFGSHRDHDNDMHSQSQINPVPPQRASQIATQTISLLSDDEDDEEDQPAAQPINHTQLNGLEAEQSDEQLLDEASEEEQSFQPPYGHHNPFDILTNQDTYGDYQSQIEDDETYEQDEFDADDGLAPNGFGREDDFSNEGDVVFDDQYYGGEDEEAENGDMEEESDEDADEEDAGDGFDDEEEDDEEDEEEESAPPQQPWRKVEYDDPWRAKPVPNPALQGQGNTEDAPIELDSD